MITKSTLIRDIILNYEHDYDAEGGAITKRRLWYILKPKFAAIPFYVAIEKTKDGKDIKVKYLENVYRGKKPVQVISNANYSKYYNDLAKAGEIDDTYVSDNSRTMAVGSKLPKIVIAVEKSTVDTVVLKLAESLGCSCYIAKGFSSVYAAKKLKQQMLIDEPYQLGAEITVWDELVYTEYPYDERAIDTPLIVLNITDYDKSGFEISDTIANHFDADEHHRVLLTKEQIPIDKIDDYFATDDKKVGKSYELDILNIHQLKETFLDSIPAHIADIITGKNRDDDWTDWGDNEIPDNIKKDERIVAIQDEIDDVQVEIDEIESTFKEQIEALEKAMGEATEKLDITMTELVLNQHSKSIEILPEHRDLYFDDDNPVPLTTVQKIAA